MNSLPTQQSDGSQIQPVGSQSGNYPESFGRGKEVESPPVRMESTGLREIGQDIDMPKEVQAAGVHVQPISVPLPASVLQTGVYPVGQHAQTSSGTVVNVPLTDAQIALGLRQGVESSWRWLAEWCRRRIKIIHQSMRRA